MVPEPIRNAIQDERFHSNLPGAGLRSLRKPAGHTQLSDIAIQTSGSSPSSCADVHHPSYTAPHTFRQSTPPRFEFRRPNRLLVSSTYRSPNLDWDQCSVCRRRAARIPNRWPQICKSTTLTTSFPIYDDTLSNFLLSTAPVHQRPLYHCPAILAFQAFRFIPCIPGVAYEEEWRDGGILFEYRTIITTTKYVLSVHT
jgi:hypothetical protein